MNGMDLGSIPVPTSSGHFVSDNHMRIAEVLRDYDPNLELEWIPDHDDKSGDPPFRVIHTDPRSGYRYIVCYAHNLDGRLLERVIQMDAAKKGDILSDIDARNKAVKLLQFKEWEEKKAEAADKAKYILRSHLNKYTVPDANGKIITIEDHGNRRR